MSQHPDYSVIVPALNEEDRLRDPLLGTMDYFRGRSLDFEVVVVDDGSTDATSEVVRTLQGQHPELRLIRLPSNRGKGFAVRTGVVNSSGRVVLFTDADGATPIQEVERLEERLEDGAEVAIGSRALSSDEVEVETRVYRKIIGRVFHTLVSFLTVGDFHDTQCGFKMLRGDVARELFGDLRMDGFSFDVELLSMALWRGYRVDEVPVNWSHVPGSSINLLTDSLRMLRDLFVIRSRLHRNAYGERGSGRYSDGSERIGEARGPGSMKDRQDQPARASGGL